MSWAEFILRSIGFRSKQERQESLFREIAYQTHSLQYMMSKKNPPSIDKFWRIGNDNKKPSLSQESKQAYLDAFEKYKKEIK
jgi:hypothetical protein